MRMWNIAAILGFAGITAVLQGIYLWKKNMKRELLCSALLLGAGTALHLLWALQVTLPSPFDWIEAVYGPVYRLLIGS